MVQWLKLPAWKVEDRGFEPRSGIQVSNKQNVSYPLTRKNIMRSLRDREVASSGLDRQDSNFASCVWKAVSCFSSHHPQEVFLTQLSLDVHTGGIKPHSFHYPFYISNYWRLAWQINADQSTLPSVHTVSGSSHSSERR